MPHRMFWRREPPAGRKRLVLKGLRLSVLRCPALPWFSVMEVFKASAKTKEELRESSAAFRKLVYSLLMLLPALTMGWDALLVTRFHPRTWALASEEKASGKDAVAEHVVTGFSNVTTADPGYRLSGDQIHALHQESDLCTSAPGWDKPRCFTSQCVHCILLCKVNRFCSNLCKPMSGRRSLLFPIRAFNPAWLQWHSGLSLVEVILEFNGYERKQHPRNKACIEPRSMSSFLSTPFCRGCFPIRMIISIVHCELGLAFCKQGVKDVPVHIAFVKGVVESPFSSRQCHTKGHFKNSSPFSCYSVTH